MPRRESAPDNRENPSAGARPLHAARADCRQRDQANLRVESFRRAEFPPRPAPPRAPPCPARRESREIVLCAPRRRSREERVGVPVASSDAEGGARLQGTPVMRAPLVEPDHVRGTARPPRPRVLAGHESTQTFDGLLPEHGAVVLGGVAGPSHGTARSPPPRARPSAAAAAVSAITIATAPPSAGIPLPARHAER